MKKSLIVLFAIALFFSCKQEVKKEMAPLPYNDIGTNLHAAVIIGDSISETYSVEAAMIKYHVPGVSIVAFQDGEIVWTKTYGKKDSKSNDAINENTKFQAASIGKPISAIGVLKLVEQYNLDLDADVNDYLKSWKVGGEFTKTKKVSIRQLLNHSAGVNVGGFHGYRKTKPIPSLLDIIEGKGNSPKVEITSIPGSAFSYSGGGYAILQLLVEDVSGQPFESFFQEQVFGPLKMNNSTFDQMPKENMALGHDQKGQTHPDGWLVFPELPAAGLWTTPTDLAKFCMALEDSYYGKEATYLSKEMAGQMLTVTNNWGLGIGVRGEGDGKYFFHGGGNPGSFKSLMLNVFKQRRGIVVMTNAGQGDKLHDDVLRSFSKFFDSNIFKPKFVKPIELSEKKRAAINGRYQFKKMGEYFLEITSDSLGRFILYDPNDESRVTYVAVSETEFVDVESGNKSSFAIDPETGKVVTMNYNGAYTFQKLD